MSATADALPPASDGRGVALLHTEAHTIIMKPIFQNFPQRWSLHLLVLLSLNLAGPSLAFAQEEKLYYFIDEHGVPHISNKPSDPRYKPYTPGKPGEQPGTSSNAQEPLAPQEMESPEVDVPDQSPEPAGAEPPSAEPYVEPPPVEDLPHRGAR